MTLTILSALIVNNLCFKDRYASSKVRDSTQMQGLRRTIQSKDHRILVRMQKLDEVVKKIPKSKDYITVPEAYALFGISKETLYRLIRKSVISSVNVGERQTRVSKEELLKLYPLRKKALAKPKPVAKLYSLEPKDCYTIGEISKKFHLEDSTVYQHIRKYSIPTRQIGNFVYVPKKEIDNLYKGMKQ